MSTFEEKTDKIADKKLDFQSSDGSVEDGLSEEAGPTKFVYSKEEKRVVRKINVALIPLFVDKSTLSYAAVMGIYEDTGITGSQFSWLGSIFYVGYLAFQIPNNYLMQRLPLSKYLGAILVVWGIGLACTALGKNFAQLAGLRFLLGFWEGSTYAAVFLLIATVYRRSEQVVWFGTMFICNAISIAVGGLIGYGIGFMQGLGNLSAWQWAMIIWGSVTTLLGIIFFIFLPDKAKSRWFRLTPEEEKIVDERTRDNAVVANKEFKVAHVYEALKEPRFYCYLLISCFLNLQNGAVTIFANQIIVDMGFSSLDSVLLNIPNGVATVILLGCAMFLSKRYDAVGIVGFIFCIIPMVGALLLCTIPSGGVKLIGLYLSATSPPYVMLQTSISGNVAGYTKKIFYTSGNLVAYCIGNFVGPLMMVEHEKPRYIGGLSGYIVADLLSSLLFLIVRWLHFRKNTEREQLLKDGRMPPIPKNREELDLTDVEDLNFTYRP
ncbi:major facilitator superfamily domain-containing protein [Fennellomyces sp. T-0311]|nr:major facilitator superfamily domain-containing protein [Fennellomyces sp. T-0311]